MGYEDRDYFQSKPKFELSSGVHPATRGLLIAVIAGYVIALIAGNHTSFASPEFFLTSAEGPPFWVRQAVVLTSHDVVPWLKGFSPGYWKLLTHWLVPADLLRCVLDAVGVYFAGRMVEELFGTRRFLALFVAACVLSGLLAALTDHWLLGSRVGVIMGPVGGMFAAFVSVAWIAPNQRTLFGWRTRPVVFGLVGFFAVIGVIYALVGDRPVAHSPTQLIWGAAVAAVYMSVLKAAGRLPAVAPGSYEEPWNRRGNLPEDVDDVSRALARARKEEEKEREQAERQRAAQAADQQKLDAILDKISRQGISSLSRGEKAFLDAQSKRRRP
ncbi:MAG: rhomboid family intramembrane serine protease [Planctomycetes bacterium]|jgi:membrane associated rhomboid family serine protease|nr:rhomboid family intramembrane serine protease [Planctomycetota bacterium]MCL4729545.1 rhomboid family intramembrane serine protease [Planctomycetota bacterium]